jgi:hypothetical protein
LQSSDCEIETADLLSRIGRGARKISPPSANRFKAANACFSLICRRLFQKLPIPVVQRSKASTFDRSLARIMGFESRRVDRCPSFVSVVCWQLEVSASGRSLVKGRLDSYTDIQNKSQIVIFSKFGPTAQRGESEFLFEIITFIGFSLT